jgi:prophage antirepressor-like protein
MSSLQVFTNPEFGEVRTTEHNGEIAFVAKDVAERLGYTWQANVIKHVPDEWKGVIPINTPGGTQEMAVLTEQGLYFFLARSDKPLALPFQKWIAGEVVPTIRKTGGYRVDPKPTGLALVKEAMDFLVSENETLQARIESDKPKVEFANQIGDCTDGVNIREFGLVFRQNGAGFGQDGFVSRLLTDHFVYRDKHGKLRPYAEHVDSGLFWEKATLISSASGNFQTFQVKITGKGQQFFLKKYLAQSILPVETGDVIPIADYHGNNFEIA